MLVNPSIVTFVGLNKFGLASRGSIYDLESCVKRGGGVELEDYKQWRLSGTWVGFRVT